MNIDVKSGGSMMASVKVKQGVGGVVEVPLPNDDGFRWYGKGDVCAWTKLNIGELLPWARFVSPDKEWGMLRRWCEEPKARLSGLEVVGCCTWWFGSLVVVVSVVKMVGDVCWLWFYSLPNYWMLCLVEFCVGVWNFVSIILLITFTRQNHQGENNLKLA